MEKSINTANSSLRSSTPPSGGWGAYKLKQKQNPANRREPAKWYAVPIYNGKISAFQLNRQVILHGKFDKDTVKKVVDTTANEISNLLKDGYSVAFDNLGTFRVSFSSKGVDKQEDFSPELIENIKVIFTPSVEFQKRLKERIRNTSISANPSKNNALIINKT